MATAKSKADVADTVKEEKSVKRATAKKEERKVLVYVGPTLKSTLLWQYRSFVNGFPPEVETLKGKYPFIKRLFVEPERVADAIKSINQVGSAMNVYYKRMKEV